MGKWGGGISHVKQILSIPREGKPKPRGSKCPNLPGRNPSGLSINSISVCLCVRCNVYTTADFICVKSKHILK